KVTPIFLIPLFARLGRWRVAIVGSGLLVIVTVVTMLASPGSWQFFTVVLPRIGLGTANWDNGSIDGLVSRIVVLSPHPLGPTTPTAGHVVLRPAGHHHPDGGQGGHRPGRADGDRRHHLDDRPCRSERPMVDSAQRRGSDDV